MNEHDLKELSRLIHQFFGCEQTDCTIDTWVMHVMEEVDRRLAEHDLPMPLYTGDEVSA